MESIGRVVIEPHLHEDRRYAQSRRAIKLSMAVNLVASLAQVTIGLLGGSQGLVAGGFESLSDLVTDGLILLAAKHAAKAADEDHPYGHKRIETAATVVLGVVLIVLGTTIAVKAALRLSHAAIPPPATITLMVAGLTIVAKELLYRYVLVVARRINSNLLRASAWHYRSDAFSSVVIAVGIAGALLGVRYLDAVAAIGVALFIIKTGAGLAWHAAQELVDTGLEADQLKRMRLLILAVPGVRMLHHLRTRRAAGVVFADVHILVDSLLSVSEGHQISEAVRAKLVREMEHVADVIVHIDPEDDEQEAPSGDLPLRDVIVARLQDRFRAIPCARSVERVNLHYLSGGIRAELILPFAAVGTIDDARRVAALFKEAVRDDPEVQAVEVLFH